MPRNDYKSLPTEMINPRTLHIDKMSTEEMMRVINEEDAKVSAAVREKESDQWAVSRDYGISPEALSRLIAAAVDAAAASFNNGGRLIYVGAGTSGRLGVVDASECPPTYGVSPDLVRGIIAGGDMAMFRAVEGAEDSEDMGRKAVEEENVSASDTVVALSASGGAPFCTGALKRAKELGAVTVAVACNRKGAMLSFADIKIVPEVGPEVIQGSTRMKAGTAQKLVLNMLSTGAMVKTGKVYGNLMINVAPTNEKLRERAIGIIMKISGCDRTSAESGLDRCGSIRGALDEMGIR